MIEEIQKHLREWVEATLEGAKVVFAPPSDTRKDRGVSLYLIEMFPKPAPRGARTQPLQIALRYLVTAFSEEASEAEKWLGDLLFASLDQPEWEAALEPVSLSLWQALSVRPRPALLLEVPVRRERAYKRVPLVRSPLVLRGSPMEIMEGVVLGPQETPITGARVELPSLHLSTRTDARGRFRFSAVPSEPRIKLLKVRAKSRETSVKTEPDQRGKLVIRFPELEG